MKGIEVKLAEGGIESLLTNSLKLNKGNKVIIVVQKELLGISSKIINKCQELGIDAERRDFNRSSFFNKKYPNEIFKELDISDSISAIILLIEWSVETTGGRLVFLRKLMNNQKIWRVASMPGIEENYLKYCKSDHNEIKRLCEDVFISLEMFDTAEITSYSLVDDKEYKLYLELGNYKPIISSGIIEAGKWGNVPSGETFCMPNPKECNGDIILKGSIPNLPLDSDEWILVSIEKGRVVKKSVEASSKKLMNAFLKLFFDNDDNLLHENCDVIAELGIGVNRNIIVLTGKPLFDEKMIGTIHLGFGSNHQFNGPIKCATHHDLVFSDIDLKFINKEKTIYKEIITNGSFKYENEILYFDDKLFEFKDKIITLGENNQYIIDDRSIKLKFSSNRNGNILIPIPTNEHSTKILDLLNMESEYIYSEEINYEFYNSDFYFKLLLNNIISINNG